MEPTASFDLVTCPKCGLKALETIKEEYYFDCLKALIQKQNTFVQCAECTACGAEFTVKFMYHFLTIQG